MFLLHIKVRAYWLKAVITSVHTPPHKFLHLEFEAFELENCTHH